MARELVRGRYRLDARLGAGGMSEVWTAEDLELGRRVALKLLGRDADPARFEREAHAVASLAHPNICRLYDYGEEGGRPFMVLEYLGGGTLEDRLLPGEPYPDDEAERIARELAAGLAHAHARDLVHRDLKPANVLFDDEGTAKIADFGIARLGGSGTLTETGTLLGTAAYLSPEQAQGQPATAASDVYSFGVILYRLLAGRLPFEAASPIELARMHVHEQPAPLGEVRPDAPPALAALAEASLAKDPQERPADGAALATALATGQPTLSGAPTLVAGADSTLVIPRRRHSGRRRLPVPPVPLPLLLVALLLFAAAAAGVAVAFLAGRSSGSKPPPSSAAQRTRSRGTSTTLPITSASARTKTTASTTRATRTSPTAVSPPPPPPPPPPPTTVPPPPTTLPTTVTIPITTPPPPPPPPLP